RTQAQFKVAWGELRAAVPQRKGAIVLGVADSHLLLDGVPVESGHAERGFAQLLTAAGVSSVQFTSRVTIEEFERLVRSFSFSGAKAEEFATHIKSAFQNAKGNIRVNEVKFVLSDPATAGVSTAAQIAAQSLGPELKEWLTDPGKLLQLIAAAEGAKASDSSHPQLSFALRGEAMARSESLFPLSEKETGDALRLLTRLGELGTERAPDPKLIGAELDRSGESIRKTVVAMLEELSLAGDSKVEKPVLMKVAEQMAIRYALERFQSGDLKVNTVHQLLEDMSRQMSGLRKLLCLQEDKMSKAGLLVESHADLLDRTFWAELPETSKKKVLLSEDAACVPARNIRQYVELLLERGDRETASSVLKNYRNQVLSEERDYRLRVGNGLAQLADLLRTTGGSLLGDTTEVVGKALARESDPEIESLLSAAFVRLTSEASQAKQYRAVTQAAATMDELLARRPGLERELRSRIGIEGRVPEFIEDALGQARLAADLLEVLNRNLEAATEHLAERFFRSMRREECDRIVELVQQLGPGAFEHLREMLRNGAQRQAVSSVGLLSRLDVAGLLELLPVRLPEWNRFYHDIIVRQIAYGAASDRGRTLLEVLELLDPMVAPQALDEIGMSGDRSASPPLIVMAEAGEAEGRSPLLQLKAIEALGRLREPEAVPVLRSLFEAKRVFKWQHHRELRIAAAQALAKIDPRYTTQVVAETGLEPGELAIGPVDSAPACPWVRQRRYDRIALRKSLPAVISSSWGRSAITVRELSLGGGMGTKDDSLRIGSDAEIDLQAGMRHIRGLVLLRRARANEVGFEFVNTDLDSRQRLRHLLMDSLEHAPEGRGGKWNYQRRLE
ncbi:MAG: HEAT repeat domain-containing protein, partial [Acidobacteria bacterium]|nr:HEAT repeat domain-containing protein [Acidobacteriota bacterium]